MSVTKKPPTVIVNLYKEIGKLINQYLTDEKPNYAKLEKAILLTLNQYYFRKHLLFRDYKAQYSYHQFSENQELIEDQHADFESVEEQDVAKNPVISPESVTYCSQVLGRKLKLANSLKDKPTNMHRLLTDYCRLTENTCWHESVIERSHRNITQQKIGGFFIELAKKLTLQCQTLADNYSAIAKSRRLEFGCYWFKVENYAAEVAEELTLFEIIRTIPTPLDLDKEKELPISLLKVLESLNTRYGLLRSCGFPPEEWLSDESLSIDDLKQIKQVTKKANALMRTGESLEFFENKKQAAYEIAFNDLKSQAKKVAGFTDFYSFFKRINSLNDVIDDDSDDEFNSEYFLELITLHPEDFNDVTSYIFQKIFVEGFTFDELLEDKLFSEKCENNPKYKNLSRNKLSEVIRKELGPILKKHSGD